MILHQDSNSRSNHNYNLWHYTNVHWAPHFHRNLELICATEGRVLVTVGGVQEALEAGQYAMVLSNQIHALQSDGPSRCWIAVFSEEFVPQFTAMVKGRQGQRAGFTCSGATAALLQQLAGGSTDLLMKKACFYAAAAEYLQAVPLTDRRTGDGVMGDILDYVAAHYREELTLEDLARRFGYEYHYLSRLLHKGYRIHFRTLVNEYRIEAAKELLLTAECSVTAAALECGFQSIRSFHHVFRQITGLAPGQWLAQQRQL